MEEVTSPPPPPPSRSRENRIVSFFKGLASISGNTVKILFNTGLVIFLLFFIIGLFGDSEDTTQSKVLYSGSSSSQIAVVNLTGTILDIVPTNPFDVISDTDVITPRKIMLVLEKIKNQSSIKAVILRINSPGGSVTASDEIYEIITRFKNETGIPVIVSMSEVAASGGYYIALPADIIVASPTTLTGSIGVIANVYNFKELADNYGVKEISINSGNNKNFLSPLQEPSEEEQNILRSIVDEAYNQFIAKVRESRVDVDPAFINVADGRPLSGNQALQYKLVDNVGSFHDTVILTREKINSPDAEVIEYGVGSILESLLQGATKPFVRSELRPLVILQQFSGKAAYLYLPFL